MEERQAKKDMVEAGCGRWHGCCFDGGHLLSRGLDFEVEDYWKKGRPKRTWEKQSEEECMGIGQRVAIS